MRRVLPLGGILLSFFLPLPFAGAARGELITFAITGTVTSVFVDPEYQSYDFPDIGDPFTGFYTFDSTAHDTANSPEQGSFKTVLPNTAVSVSIGQFQFEARSSVIVTFQDYYAAGEWITGIELTSDPALGQLLNHNNFSLVVRKENMFHDPNVLPLTPPSLAGADQATLMMDLDDRDDLRPFPEVSIIAMLESLRVVPEPLSMVLMAIGLMWALQTRHRLNGRNTRR